MLANSEILTETPLSESARFAPYTSDSTLPDVSLRRVVSFRLKTSVPEPISIPVTGIRRDVRVKVASTPDEWEQAYRLVTTRYKEKGYADPRADELHFTAHHALPDTVTFVAKEEDRVLATVSLVPDNTVLGFPMEIVYGDEIAQLRRMGHRLNEVTCLADTDLSPREFLPVFMQLCRLLVQYTASQGSNEWIIEVNPRHVAFYKKIWGFVPIGPRRACPHVQGAPAEAFYMNIDLMRQNAPRTYDFVYRDPLPMEALTATSMPADLARYFAGRSCQTDATDVEEVLGVLDDSDRVRRW